MACPFLIDRLQGIVALEEIPSVARYLQAGRRVADYTHDGMEVIWVSSGRRWM